MITMKFSKLKVASTGVKWSLKQNPGFSFTVVSCPTSFATTLTGNLSGYISCAASVSYRVEVFPIRLVFSGVVKNRGASSILMGQQLTASLEKPGVPVDPSDSFIWAISGNPFASFSVSPDSSLGYRPPSLALTQHTGGSS